MNNRIAILFSLAAVAFVLFLYFHQKEKASEQSLQHFNEENQIASGKMGGHRSHSHGRRKSKHKHPKHISTFRAHPGRGGTYPQYPTYHGIPSTSSVFGEAEEEEEEELPEVEEEEEEEPETEKETKKAPQPPPAPPIPPPAQKPQQIYYENMAPQENPEPPKTEKEHDRIDSQIEEKASELTLWSNMLKEELKKRDQLEEKLTEILLNRPIGRDYPSEEEESVSSDLQQSNDQIKADMEKIKSIQDDIVNLSKAQK